MASLYVGDFPKLNPSHDGRFANQEYHGSFFTAHDYFFLGRFLGYTLSVFFNDLKKRLEWNFNKNLDFSFAYVDVHGEFTFWKKKEPRPLDRDPDSVMGSLDSFLS